MNYEAKCSLIRDGSSLRALYCNDTESINMITYLGILQISQSYTVEN